MLFSQVLLLATAGLTVGVPFATSADSVELLPPSNTSSFLVPRRNPGTHHGIEDETCEGTSGSRCDLKREKIQRGKKLQADSEALTKCVHDLERSTDPELPGRSKQDKEYTKHHWNNEGWVCADRIWQIGSTRHKKHFPHTVYHACMSPLAVAAEEGRDWVRCTVTSPAGLTRRHWISWSPKGCRNGNKKQKTPVCKAEYENEDRGLPVCMDPPCKMVNGLDMDPV